MAKREKRIKIEGKGSPTDVREIKSKDDEREKQWQSGRHPLGNGSKGWWIKHK